MPTSKPKTDVEDTQELDPQAGEEVTGEPTPNVREDGRMAVTVHLLPRHAEWLQRVAHYEGLVRRCDWTLDQHIEYLVRQAYALDPTKGGTLVPGAGGSGPREAFNPVGGDWNK